MNHDCIGKTLAEVSKESHYNPKGVAVFVLQSEEDYTGKRAAESFSLKIILQSNPELADKKVVLYNIYFGEDVYRVI